DDVYRLDHSSLNGTTNLQMSYTPTGNITSRSDNAGGTAWTYDASHLHAVVQAGSGGISYTYDADGNAISRGGQPITWSSYNHPLAISSPSGESITFAYNHNHERWRSIYSGSSGTETTYFVGTQLEKVITAGNVEYRHYIFAGNEKVAVYSRTSAGTNTLRYIREDHQGGVSAILNADGSSYVKESFAAYGARRSSCTWSGPPTSGNLALINNVTRHGYTWHTALGAMGLNDMNGRIEDAVTGRFLSPDPTVPSPVLTQSHNRYSYVNNNPLSLIDPSGFEPDTRCTDSCPGSSPGGIPPSPDKPTSEVHITGTRDTGGEQYPDYSPRGGADYDGNSGGTGNGSDRGGKGPGTPSPGKTTPPELPCSGPSCTQTVSGSPPFSTNFWWIPGNVYYGPPDLSPYPGGPVRGPLAYPLSGLPRFPGLCTYSRANNPHAGRNILGGAIAGAGITGTVYTAIAVLNLEDGAGEVMLALRIATLARNSATTLATSE